MQRTDIEYLTHVWNPLAMRCDPVSEGCAHCWHIRMANRLAGNPAIDCVRRLAYSGGRSEAVMVEGEMDAPARRKNPSVIGVQFMGDLWHSSVTHEHRAAITLAMSAVPWHEYVVLTKRPEGIYHGLRQHSNVWIGVSTENQCRFDERWGHPSLRWVSVEPMLGPVTLRVTRRLPEWIACGPETGPGARPCDPRWIERLALECQARGIRFFDKRPDFIRRELPWTIPTNRRTR